MLWTLHGHKLVHDSDGDVFMIFFADPKGIEDPRADITVFFVVLAHSSHHAVEHIE